MGWRFGGGAARSSSPSARMMGDPNSRVERADARLANPLAPEPTARVTQPPTAVDAGQRFEMVVLPHVPAAYNLSRWLLGNEHDAEDVVQDACVRAFTQIGSLRGIDGRSWLLTIVRNACYTHLKRRNNAAILLDDEHDQAPLAADPEDLVLRRLETERVRAEVAALPVAIREAIVLREFEGLSYKEIADVAEVPIGTVMSRISRGRRLLARALADEGNGGGHGLH